MMNIHSYCFGGFYERHLEIAQDFICFMKNIVDSDKSKLKKERPFLTKQKVNEMIASNVQNLGDFVSAHPLHDGDLNFFDFVLSADGINYPHKAHLYTCLEILVIFTVAPYRFDQIEMHLHSLFRDSVLDSWTYSAMIDASQSVCHQRSAGHIYPVQYWISEKEEEKREELKKKREEEKRIAVLKKIGPDAFKNPWH